MFKRLVLKFTLGFDINWTDLICDKCVSVSEGLKNLLFLFAIWTIA